MEGGEHLLGAAEKNSRKRQYVQPQGRETQPESQEYEGVMRTELRCLIIRTR
jgi:hypothetical protein